MNQYRPGSNEKTPTAKPTQPETSPRRIMTGSCTVTAIKPVERL